MFSPLPPRRILRGRTRGKKNPSLAGAWSGEYGYDVPPIRQNVPFNAVLGDAEGVLSGTIDEPNTFGNPSAERLFATIEGTRSGREVRFAKTYNGAGGVRHVVHYAGEANDDFSRIDGVWRLSWRRGPFYMTRAAAAAVAEEADREAEAGA